MTARGSKPPKVAGNEPQQMGFAALGTPPAATDEPAEDGRSIPLAERMRPRQISEFVGQQHLLGPRGVLSRFLSAGSDMPAGGRLPSLILVGPPGSGKTTLAQLIATATDAAFSALSATDAGVADLRRVVEQARSQRRQSGRATLLFIDEIHRFNRGQQDALLPHVEAGTLTLVGATTEHPGFHVNAALLSRSRVVELRALGVEELVELGRRALLDEDHGMGSFGVRASDDVLAMLAGACEGDARRMLNHLELAVDLACERCTADEHGHRYLDAELLTAAVGKRRPRYDKDGDEHYAVTSAFIKSMRASDADASIYWLARMIEGGEDPVFIARRLVIFASEDIGNADPHALTLATAAAEAVRFVGMPEASHALAQATLRMALAVKSNAAYRALSAARRECRRSGALPVPLEIRNAVTKLHRQQGHGRGYRYPHDFDGHVDQRHTSFLPEALYRAGTRFVELSPNGWEALAGQRLQGQRGQPGPQSATPTSAPAPLVVTPQLCEPVEVARCVACESAVV